MGQNYPIKELWSWPSANKDKIVVKGRTFEVLERFHLCEWFSKREEGWWIALRVFVKEITENK